MSNDIMIHFKNLSKSLDYYKSRDLENALLILKTISNPFEETKSKSICDNEKNKTTIVEFKLNLVIILNKIKSLYESYDKYDSLYLKLLYNFALILNFCQQTLQSSSLYDNVTDISDTCDINMVSKLKLLMADNYFVNQSYEDLIKIIQSIVNHESLSSSMLHSHYLFLFVGYIMLKKYDEAHNQLKELSKQAYPLLSLYESQYLYYQWDMSNSLQSILIPKALDEFNMSFVWNNISCIYFQMCRFNIALMNSRRALIVLDINSKKKKSSDSCNPQKLTSIGRPYDILQNYGLQLLFANKPIEAFDILLDIINVHPKNPRIWLRLAECCIKAYHPEELGGKSKSNLVEKVVGTGHYKKVVLTSDQKECCQPVQGVAAMPTPSLEFASLCIKNAQAFLPKPPAHISVQSENYSDQIVEWYKTQLVHLKPSGNTICGMDCYQLQISIWLTGAYVALCLGSAVETRNLCGQILRQPTNFVSHYTRYLARIYLAEAITRLTTPQTVDNNWSQLKQQLLNHKNIKSISVVPEIISAESNNTSGDQSKSTDMKISIMNQLTEISSAKYMPSSLEEAQSIVSYNLSVCSSLLQTNDMPSDYSPCDVVWPKFSTRYSDQLNRWTCHRQLRSGHCTQALRSIYNLALNARTTHVTAVPISSHYIDSAS